MLFVSLIQVRVLLRLQALGALGTLFVCLCLCVFWYCQENICYFLS